MDLAATLVEIMSLSVEERIQIVKLILDTVAADQCPAELTEAQKGELDRRIQELNDSPENVLTWEQIKAHVRGTR
jgi:putative addiction module component (TIGR02574 family)